jgi:uncharacterized membrane protein
MGNTPLAAYLEYGLLGLVIIAASLLAGFSKIGTTDAIALITASLGYGVGSAKGAAIVSAITRSSSTSNAPEQTTAPSAAAAPTTTPPFPVG